jgi:hypothetical protein
MHEAEQAANQFHLSQHQQALDFAKYSCYILLFSTHLAGKVGVSI